MPGVSNRHPDAIIEIRWKCMTQQAARNKRMISHYSFEPGMLIATDLIYPGGHCIMLFVCLRGLFCINEVDCESISSH